MRAVPSGASIGSPGRSTGLLVRKCGGAAKQASANFPFFMDKKHCYAPCFCRRDRAPRVEREVRTASPPAPQLLSLYSDTTTRGNQARGPAKFLRVAREQCDFHSLAPITKGKNHLALQRVYRGALHRLGGRSKRLL